MLDRASLIQGEAERTPRFGRGIASGGERVQWWGALRRTAVYVPFSVYTMAWSGKHRAFIVEEFIRNCGSPVATQRAFRIRFPLGRRETVPDKKTITVGYQTLDKQVLHCNRHLLADLGPQQDRKMWQLSGLPFRNPHGVLHGNMRLHYGCLHTYIFIHSPNFM